MLVRNPTIYGYAQFSAFRFWDKIENEIYCSFKWFDSRKRNEIEPISFGLVWSSFGFDYGLTYRPIKLLSLLYRLVCVCGSQLAFKFYFYSFFSWFWSPNRREKQFTISKSKIDNYYTKIHVNLFWVCFKIKRGKQISTTDNHYTKPQVSQSKSMHGLH